MPSIKYKKKTYAGATFPVLEMTKAEYDALPEAKKMDGTVYMITDDTGGWEAENSAYDNTQSGLTATNVQDALDEVVSTVSQEFIFETQRFTNISVSANSFTSLTLSGKTGYTLVSIYFILGGSNSGYGGFVKMNAVTTFLVTNITNNAVSGWAVDAKCLWKKS